MQQAHLAENLRRYPRNRHLPTVDQLLKPAREAVRQSPGEMLEAFQEWKAAGAPITIKQVS